MFWNSRRHDVFSPEKPSNLKV
uniref:Uncharacterized protein n=1 Tax=Rhizophora mucronata TaxID=61149 RepID=A0A2P2IXL2_RHIMU